MREVKSAIGVLALVLLAVMWVTPASADPPGRVARLGYVEGAVTFSPSGEDDWVQAVINRPLITGDRLWTDSRARAELDVGSAVVRADAFTSVSILNLDDETTQFNLEQGTLKLRVWSLQPGEVFEVDTPTLAFSILAPGDYRISVDDNGSTTTVVTRDGEAQAFGDGASYVVGRGQSYAFHDPALRQFDFIASAGDDAFDRWADARDRRWTDSVSARYVSREVIGYEELDTQGSWTTVESYGPVWVPNVAPDWVPYRDGHWAWVNPWGWTWVDDARWGFAVSHYGRWARLRDRWCWVPGPRNERPVYAPALVAFVGGPNVRLSLSTGGSGAGVAWFPLGPREIYRPSYEASREYFTRVNRSNTIVNVNITNVYNNRDSTRATYVNQRVPGAVVAVPAASFAQSQTVSHHVVALSRESLTQAGISERPNVAPVRQSVTGAARPATSRPNPQVMQRQTIVRTPPPAAAVAFSRQEAQLAATPGRPLSTSTLATMQRASPNAPPARVTVVAPTRGTTAVGPTPNRESAATRGPPPATGQPASGANAMPSPESERMRVPRSRDAATSAASSPVVPTPPPPAIDTRRNETPAAPMPPSRDMRREQRAAPAPQAVLPPAPLPTPPQQGAPTAPVRAPTVPAPQSDAPATSDVRRASPNRPAPAPMRAEELRREASPAPVAPPPAVAPARAVPAVPAPPAPQAAPTAPMPQDNLRTREQQGGERPPRREEEKRGDKPQ